MAIYCVVFREPGSGRAVRFYLNASSADTAFATALAENPLLQPLGVEIADRAVFTQHRLQAA